MTIITFYKTDIYEDSKTSGSRYVPLDKNIFHDGRSPFKLPRGNLTYCDGIIEIKNDYLWIAGKYGKSEPRADNLTNVKTGKKKPNQRRPNEAELLDHLFCLYDFTNEKCFIHPTDKQAIFKSILSLKSEGRDFVFQDVYKSIGEVMEIIGRLDEIQFTHLEDLFNKNSTEKKALVDLTGSNAPTKFTIKAQYKQPLSENMRKFLVAKYKLHPGTMIIKGADANDFPFVFNAKTFQEKLSIVCEKDIKNEFDADEVKEKIIKQLRSQNDQE